jgi:hypothetical protein
MNQQQKFVDMPLVVNYAEKKCHMENESAVKVCGEK